MKDKIVITNSERSTYRRCIRKWHYTYEKLRITPNIPEPLWFGSAIGLGLDGIWEQEEDFMDRFVDYIEANAPKTGKDWQEKLMTAYYKGRAMLNAYKALYANDMDIWELVEVEAPVFTNIQDNIWLRGMIDKVIRNKRTGKLVVMDHKTTKDDLENPAFDYWRIKSLDPQLVGYREGLEKSTGEKCDMLYDSIKKFPSGRKSTVRKRKDESTDEFALRKADNIETWDDYYDRVLAEYTNNPTKYFKRQYIHRTEDEYEEFIEELVEDAKAIAHTKESQVYPKNHGMCEKLSYKCEYFDICTKVDCGGDIMLSDNFKTKANRHPELDGDEIKEETNGIII